MKEFKYKISFSSKVKVLGKNFKNLDLSTASLDQLKKFIPNIESDAQKELLLPVAFNSCVAGMINLNNHGIDIDTGLKIYKDFIGSFCDLEHNRQQLVGCIVSAHLSEFGTDEELTEKEAEKNNKPFNLTLGAILWRIINEKFCNLVEECANPNSSNYEEISASWELCYDDYNLVLIDGKSKNIQNGKIISDKPEIEKLEAKLVNSGGLGKLDENTYVYKVVKGIPMGIGFTTHPASQIKGVAAEEVKLKINISNDIKTIENVTDSTLIKENLSQLQEKVVKTSRKTDMKITSLKDI